MFLKNRKIIFKMKISKVTDYAALIRACISDSLAFNVAVPYQVDEKSVDPDQLASSEAS